MHIDPRITPHDLLPQVNRLLELAQSKIRLIERTWDPARGAPVFTVRGRYAAQGWTPWTLGFQFGSAILCSDGTGDEELLELGRRRTLEHMPALLTHTGVHDHGFNIVSTYGNLRRLLREGATPANPWELHCYELALKVSGAVQAARWAGTAPRPDSPHSAKSPALGYIYSFNGPHSLFIDTLRSLRSLVIAWQLGHALFHENDKRADLLKRSVLHALTTSQYLVFHGDGEHAYDEPGRTAHEGVFNRNDGSFRCRSTQQGYSPFSTWTRGLAWAILGYSEQLEFLQTLAPEAFLASTGVALPDALAVYERCAVETAEHYLRDCAADDGVPYWDAGAPGLERLGDWRERAADPFNDHEPVDASAAVIAAQGMLRLSRCLTGAKSKRWLRAGLTLARTVFDEPYLATDRNHQGLILHSVYHRPNAWDYVPREHRVPCGESCMWGDYHALELALYLQRLSSAKPYLAFFDR